MLKIFTVIVIVFSLGCTNQSIYNTSKQSEPNIQGSSIDQSMIEAIEEEEMMTMKMSVNGSEFEIELADNSTAKDFKNLIENQSITLQLQDYAGFEKVGPLNQSLTRNDVQTTTEIGDIVLYSGNQIVIFYGSNSWSYSRIGKVKDLTGFTEALGSSDVEVIFYFE